MMILTIVLVYLFIVGYVNSLVKNISKKLQKEEIFKIILYL